MGHHCCSKQKVKRGLWSPEEDTKLINCITTHGHACWSVVPRLAGLQRCGKSCRLRWINYLRPDLKRGSFSAQEERIIIDVHRILGNRWAQIAKHLPGRTDNEVKNFWNSSIKKKLIAQGLDPNTHNLIPSHHQRNMSNENACNVNQFYQQQQPSSGFSITMDKNPPPMTIPIYEHQIPSHGWPTNDQSSQPLTGFSNLSSIPIPSITIPSDQFGLFDHESSFWCDDGNGMKQAAETQGVMQQQEQQQQEDMEACLNECSDFDLEFMDIPCGVMLTNINSMDQLEWDL